MVGEDPERVGHVVFARKYSTAYVFDIQMYIERSKYSVPGHAPILKVLAHSWESDKAFVVCVSCLGRVGVLYLLSRGMCKCKCVGSARSYVLPRDEDEVSDSVRTSTCCT